MYILSARRDRIRRDIISAWLHAEIGPPSKAVHPIVPDEMVHAIEVAPRRRAIVEHRTEEPLCNGRRLAGVVESLGEAGRQPSTGALPTNRDTSGICPKVRRLAPQPSPPRQAIIQSRWERIPGRFAVFHGDDKDSKFPCGERADAIILDGAPDDQPAAMNPEQRRWGAPGSRTVDAHGRRGVAWLLDRYPIQLDGGHDREQRLYHTAPPGALHRDGNTCDPEHRSAQLRRDA
jgi:hypothetical protein